MDGKEGEGKSFFFKRKASRKAHLQEVQVDENSAASNHLSASVKSSTLPLNRQDHVVPSISPSPSEGLFSKLKRRFKIRSSRGKYDLKDYTPTVRVRRKSDDPNVMKEDCREDERDLRVTSSVKTPRRIQSDKEDVILIRKNKRVSVLCKNGDSEPEIIFSNMNSEDDESVSFGECCEEDPYATINSVKEEINEKFMGADGVNKVEKLEKDRAKARELLSKSMKEPLGANGGTPSPVENVEDLYAKIKPKSKEPKVTKSDGTTPVTEFSADDVAELNRVSHARLKSRLEPEYETLEDVRQRSSLMYDGVDDGYKDLSHDSLVIADGQGSAQVDPDYETLEDVKQRVEQSFSSSSSSKATIHKQSSSHYSKAFDSTSSKLSGSVKSTSASSFSTNDTSPGEGSEGSKDSKADSNQRAAASSAYKTLAKEEMISDTKVSYDDPSQQSSKGPAPLASSVDSTLPTEESLSSPDSPTSECIYDNPNVILRKQMNRGSLGPILPSSRHSCKSPNPRTLAEEELVEKLSSLLAPPLPLRNYMKDEVSRAAGNSRHSWASPSPKFWDMSESWHGADWGKGRSPATDSRLKTCTKSKSQELFEGDKVDNKSSSGTLPKVMKVNHSTKKKGEKGTDESFDSKARRSLSPQFRIIPIVKSPGLTSETSSNGSLTTEPMEKVNEISKAIMLKPTSPMCRILPISVIPSSSMTKNITSSQPSRHSSKDEPLNSDMDSGVNGGESFESTQTLNPFITDGIMKETKDRDCFEEESTSRLSDTIESQCPCNESSTGSVELNVPSPSPSDQLVVSQNTSQRESKPVDKTNSFISPTIFELEGNLQDDVNNKRGEAGAPSHLDSDSHENIVYSYSCLERKDSELTSGSARDLSEKVDQPSDSVCCESRIEQNQSDGSISKLLPQDSHPPIGSPSHSTGSHRHSLIMSEEDSDSLSDEPQGMFGTSKVEDDSEEYRDINEMDDDTLLSVRTGINPSPASMNSQLLDSGQQCLKNSRDCSESISNGRGGYGSHSRGNTATVSLSKEDIFSTSKQRGKPLRGKHGSSAPFKAYKTPVSCLPFDGQQNNHYSSPPLTTDVDESSMAGIRNNGRSWVRESGHPLPRILRHRISGSNNTDLEYASLDSGDESDPLGDLEHYNENAPSLYEQSSDEEFGIRIENKPSRVLGIMPRNETWQEHAGFFPDGDSWCDECRRNVPKVSTLLGRRVCGAHKCGIIYAYNTYQPKDFAFNFPPGMDPRIRRLLLERPVLLENIINGHICLFIGLNPYYVYQGSFRWSRIFSLSKEHMKRVERKLYDIFYRYQGMTSRDPSNAQSKRGRFRQDCEYWAIVEYLNSIQEQATFHNLRMHILGTDRLLKLTPMFKNYTCTLPKTLQRIIKIEDFRISEEEFETSRESVPASENHALKKYGNELQYPLPIEVLNGNGNSEKQENTDSSETAQKITLNQAAAPNSNQLSPGFSGTSLSLLPDFMELCSASQSNLCGFEDDSDEDDEEESVDIYIHRVAIAERDRMNSNVDTLSADLSFSRALRGELAYTARLRPPGKGLKNKMSSWFCSGMDSHLSFSAWEEMDQLMKKLIPHMSPRLDFQFLLRLYGEFKFFILKDRRRNKQRRGCFFVEFCNGIICCKKEEFVFLKLIRDELRYFSFLIQGSAATEALFLEEHSVAYSLTRLLTMVLETICKMKQSMHQCSTDDATAEAGGLFDNDPTEPFSRIEDFECYEPRLGRSFLNIRLHFHLASYKNFRTSSMWYDLQNWQPPTDFLDDPNLLQRNSSVFTHADNAIHVAQFGGYEDPKPLHEREGFTESMQQLRSREWYWGPLSYEQAILVLKDHRDGTFLVRDSSDKKYLLSLSFISLGEVQHTRIEHAKGLFSFWSQPESHKKGNICEFIDISVQNSKDGRFLYFMRPNARGTPPIPIRLLYPLSRNFRPPSLKHLSRFVIRQSVRIDHIKRLPLPQKVKAYLFEKQYFVEIHMNDNWAFEREGSVPA